MSETDGSFLVGHSFLAIPSTLVGHSSFLPRRRKNRRCPPRSCLRATREAGSMQWTPAVFVIGP